jgi:ribosomal protein S18 acetylase RimI-like enzyme
MRIRRAIHSDYQDLMILYNGFVNEDRYSRLDNDSFDQVIRSKTNYIFVAEDKGRIVAFVAFSVRNVVRYPKLIAEIDEIFVSISYQRKGLGVRLMDAVESKAKELDCHRIFIESHYDHKPAHKFYEKLGYTNYGYHFIKNL